MDALRISLSLHGNTVSVWIGDRKGTNKRIERCSVLTAQCNRVYTDFQAHAPQWTLQCRISYLLQNGCKSILLCLQAFIIRHLVFKYKTKEEIFARRYSGQLRKARNRKPYFVAFIHIMHMYVYIVPAFSRILEPTQFERNQALLKAVCQVLWQAGDSTSACVCLPGEAPAFRTTELYRADSVTEKVGNNPTTECANFACVS